MPDAAQNSQRTGRENRIISRENEKHDCVAWPNFSEGLDPVEGGCHCTSHEGQAYGAGVYVLESRMDGPTITGG